MVVGAGVRERFPVLSQAILNGASAQIRNMATVGGNILQRTRCHYFYDQAARCNKRERGAGCDARGGFNRIHAILGASPECIATHPLDMCVTLAALDASVRLEGAGGARSLPLRELHRLPGDTPDVETTLRPGELIVAVEIPATPFARRSLYRKVRDRASYAFALVSVAAALDVAEDGTVRKARIALGGVAHKPWRAAAAKAALRGASASCRSRSTRCWGRSGGACAPCADMGKKALGRRSPWRLIRLRPLAEPCLGRRLSNCGLEAASTCR